VSIEQHYKCDACGKDVPNVGRAIEFSGSWHAQAAVAMGSHVWHSCGAACAAKLLRDAADKIVGHDTKLDSRRHALLDDMTKK